MKVASGYWKDWQVYLEDKLGNRLPEHNIEVVTAGHGVKLHLECKHGQEFEIVVVRPHFAAAKGVDCDATVLIDGHRIGGIAFAATYFSDTAKKGHKYEKHNGAVYQKSLKFSELRRTEDGPMIGVAQAKELGNIRVRLRGGRFSEPKYSVPKRAHRALLEVSEKVKKGRAASCVSGDLIKPAALRSTVHLIHDKTIPEFKVTFMYATREALMANEVIPNPHFETVPAPPRDPPRNAVASGSRSSRRARSEPPSDDDSIVAIEDCPAKKKRKIHTVDLTDDSRPPIFVNLADDTDSSDSEYVTEDDSEDDTEEGDTTTPQNEPARARTHSPAARKKAKTSNKKKSNKKQKKKQSNKKGSTGKKKSNARKTELKNNDASRVKTEPSNVNVKAKTEPL